MITLSLNILDIVQNSIRAKASVISIEIRDLKSEDILEIKITDNGSGIPVKFLKYATDPFFTTRNTRKSGMGLPLLKYHAEITGGDLKIKSTEGKGTIVTAKFSLSHIDRQPLGDIAGVMIILIAANPEINFIYTHRTDKGEYTFSSKETKEYLEINNFNNSILNSSIKEMINCNLYDICASDYSERIGQDYASRK